MKPRPRFKEDQRAQDQMFCASLLEQLIPGTLEHAIDYLVDNKIGTEPFESRYSNHEAGQKAYDPRALLKVVLYAYSMGLGTSRKMEKACRTNLVFMALAGGATPDHSTFAAFVSNMGEIASEAFRRILLACDEQGLIGYTHFSLDGVKLPANASREWSGKRKDFQKKSEKLKAKIQAKIEEHKKADAEARSDDDRHAAQVERLERHAAKVDAYLARSEPKIGESGKEVNDNVTDPESCLMKTRHGMVQGYNAQALVEQENQVIVSAGVEATGHDQKLASRALDEASANLEGGKLEKGALTGAYFTADCQYHSEENIQAALDHGMEAYIPDNRFRQRDPAFQGRERHKPKPKARKRFDVSEFEYDKKNDLYVCPNGKPLKLAARKARKTHNLYRRYASRKRDCAGCPLRDRCLENANRKTRTINVPLSNPAPTLRQLMKERIDTPEARQIYGKRMHIVEPVFGNLRHNKGLGRFTLRGKDKVNAQWLLYCCVHNAEKWAKAAFAELFAPSRPLNCPKQPHAAILSLPYQQKRLENPTKATILKAA
ncbi:IS1182 family transposase [Pelagicoccus sp. SDUM812005]|uniref:IS1182 family transposase n=1 Tax=Pelagicoccus sp. SDUM812005 TaxID=3041257 RepID=UPI00280C5297|nr:IS1182 family transposase [Pelagicoccus sp. SDUM812005]MDQ8183833.1 IS1182 family transposase [Pelagicoccus sp. SDUM812005]